VARRAGTPATEIGEKIAVARALSDVAHLLLGSAAAQLEDVTRQQAQLHP
jgi:hypothetical protein